MEKYELYKKALDKFGIDNQRWMLVEECGELLDALAKMRRGRTSFVEIITELADVHIMVEQMACFFGLEDFLDEKKRKLARLEERLYNHELSNYKQN